jgi:serine/threonine protein kinase
VPLTRGTQLGAYEILGLIGTGGMAEVYRARDTRLDRTVAIKVLTASFAASALRRERFEREARAISSLNHPHICALYDVGEVPTRESSAGDDTPIRFLVLEYLEGQTLAERLTRGPLPPADALRHAIAIADALDKAHRSGIVHRDLKPANVMLTDGGVKLLDFGLAKSAAPAVPAGANTESLPPTAITIEGTILGTCQYMAPEQIEGREADARSDIFALGALLFEMVTGRVAFEGETRASVISSILKDEPPRLQAAAPSELDRIIRTCLAKDPDDRYQSARDLGRDLRWAASGSSDGLVSHQAVIPAARPNRLPWLVAAVLAVALLALAAIEMRRASPPTPAAGQMRFTIPPPENASLGGPIRGGTGTATQLAVSPDGRQIVFVARTGAAYRIWLRRVAMLEATPIQGTEGGTFPFWSPDSRSIGFFADGKLKTVQIAGGPPIVLADAPTPMGGSWSRQDGWGRRPQVAALSSRWPSFLLHGRHGCVLSRLDAGEYQNRLARPAG